ncbi:MAG: DNA repair protein RadC [Candidatus Nanohaloarchaeota archaeon QJJ-9]|nr:DNA repair protein RadC [Candidatus Nanohaloarchaeota archaeon QJJ-9]
MDYTIKDLPESERPRERLKQTGPKSLSEAELLALILRTGTEKKNVKKLANELLKDLGIEGLRKAGREELKQYRGIGEVKASQILGLFELSSRRGNGREEKLESFEDAKKILEPRLTSLEQEELHAIYINSSNQIKNVKKIYRGSLREINLDTRDIVREALKTNASAVIIGHNHPEGVAEPTKKDIEATKQVKKALEKFGVKLLDHLVFGKENCTSLKREGKL